MYTSSKTRLIVAAAVVVMVVGGWYLWSNRVEATTITQDTIIEGDYMVGAREKTVLAGGATLNINGNMTLDGDIECADGPLVIIVSGDVTVNDATLRCEDNSGGVSVVVAGALTLGEDSQIVANGPIQIVNNAENLATEPEDFERLYADAETPSGATRVGPMIDATGTGSAGESAVIEDSPLFAAAHAGKTRSKTKFGIAVAEAQDIANINIAGRIRILTPPKDDKRPIVVFNFPGAEGVRIQNLDLQGPDGHEGDGDVSSSCNARGGDGGDAMRFLAYAGSLTVDDFTLTLGSGGVGGTAETQADCHPQATATGGKGGKSGNFKMVAENNFQINGSFIINPGRGGDGGAATAHGKEGGPSEDGAAATATGGAGADNVKTLGMSGTVAGVSNVQVGSIHGGAGGNATANPGGGGAGPGCGADGGAGGNANATGGKGGNARVNLVGGATRTAGSEDVGGNGGDASSTGAAGGAGGGCDASGPGGNGGKGGDATSTEGRAGTGNPNGADGAKTNESGGNGGNGGDGCGPGAGGAGGNGNPQGKEGDPGKNLCVEPEEEEETNITPGSGGTGTSDTEATVEIEVIQYGGKYIPVNQLIIEEHSGCDGAAHWHSAGGPVAATDGSTVVDPGSPCGFGKTSQVPVMKIRVPAVHVEVNFQL